MSRAFAFMFFVAFSAGCLDSIEHQAPDHCASSTDCPCAQECVVTDGGARNCVASTATVCVHSTDCHLPLVCADTHRNDAGCGHFECQHP